MVKLGAVGFVPDLSRIRALRQYLGRHVRAGVLSLVQLVPALHEFNNHGIAKVHQLKACHIGSPMHETL